MDNSRQMLNAKDDPSKFFSYIATKITYDSIQPTTETTTVTNTDTLFLTTSAEEDPIPDPSLAMGSIMHEIDNEENNKLDDEFMQNYFVDFDFDCGTTIEDLIG